MMLTLVGRRAQRFIAGVGVLVSAAVCGCYSPPTRSQNQTQSNIPRTNTNGTPASNGNSMTGSAPIPTPPGTGTANSTGMNQSAPNANGMNSNSMPANGSSTGMTYPNGGMQPNMQNGGLRSPPTYASTNNPAANQMGTGTPGYYDQRPMSPNPAPIASNAGTNTVMPASYQQRPNPVTAPITNPIPTGPAVTPDLPPPSVMTNTDPNLFRQNKVPQMPASPDAMPLKVGDDGLMPTPLPSSSSEPGGPAPLSPPPLR